MSMTPARENITFTAVDPASTIGALSAAKDWLDANGYSYGAMDRDKPIGVLRGDGELDGRLLPGSDGTWRNECRLVWNDVRVSPANQRREKPCTTTT